VAPKAKNPLAADALERLVSPWELDTVQRTKIVADFGGKSSVRFFSPGWPNATNRKHNS